MCLTLEDRDAEEMVLVLKGYYQLMAGTELPVDCPPDNVNSADDSGMLSY